MEDMEESGGDGVVGGGPTMLKNRFSELCEKLNVDAQARDDAWNEFIQINTNVTLEGESLHWLACSLYVSCRKLSVIREQLSIDVAGISLGELLATVKLSLLQFFQKVRKWLDMGKHGSVMNEKIEQLERIFSVSSIVFEQYSNIFNEIYQEEWREELRRGRKKQTMSTKEMSRFCWTLYVCTKAQYPDISDDLVNSYHLMLCCLDLIFSNTLSIRQLKGSFREDFKGLPEDYMNTDVGDDAASIIDVLCQAHNGLPIETKIIKQQHLDLYIEDLLRNGHLKGNREKKTGLLDIMNYESNLKYLTETYNKHTMKKSSIDEKIFIRENSIVHIGSPSRRVTAFSEVDDCKDTSTAASTDLSITLAVSRLQELVKGCKPSPSEKLQQMFASLKEDPSEKVAKALSELRRTFRDHCSGKDIAEARLHLVVVLFYKIMESFLDVELNQKKTTSDMSALMSQEVFLKCLFTCSLEIVIFSYKQELRLFPWILRVFSLKPYHFFKIIELVIRSEDLSRDVIKHLSRVEDQILESLTWQTNSPIFASIGHHGVPRCQEVASETAFSTPLLFMSPTTVRMSKDGIYNSPVMTMRGKLNSPLPSSPARRNLFGSPSKSDIGASPKGKVTTAVILPPKTTANMMQSQFPIMLTSPGKDIRLYTMSPQNQQHGVPPQTSASTSHGIIRLTASPSKSAGLKKFGSLGIFFRKLYHMSSVRLKHLCENLQIGTELQKKIWTCFEHSLTENVELLRDRHIDQLMMCAVYVICKVSKEEKSFHEIMKWYRTQPQAKSDVYRHVLIKRTKEEKPAREEKPAKDDEEKKDEKTGNGNADDTDGSEVEGKFIYNDLIQFYNIVYIKQIKEFALKFAANKTQTEPLSPLPVTRKQVQSPRKLSKQHQIYISPIKSAANMTPKSKMLFCFDSDSPKKLTEINQMIKGGTRRRVNFDEDMPVGGVLGATPPKRPLMNGITRRAEELRHEQSDMSRAALSTNHF